MKQMGLQVINTGCPSLWSISSEHRRITHFEKGKCVVTRLTSYRKDHRADKTLFKVLRHAPLVMNQEVEGCGEIL